MRLVRDGKPFCYKAVRRVADVVLSSGALVVLSPVMLGAAIAIMVEDGCQRSGNPVSSRVPRYRQSDESGTAIPT